MSLLFIRALFNLVLQNGPLDLKWAMVVDVLGTGTVTITTRVNKRLQTLVLSDANISFFVQGETYFQITAHNGRCVAMDTYHDIIIRFMKQILMMGWERYRT
jgi:hypothetical protein